MTKSFKQKPCGKDDSLGKVGNAGELGSWTCWVATGTYKRLEIHLSCASSVASFCCFYIKRIIPGPTVIRLWQHGLLSVLVHDSTTDNINQSGALELDLWGAAFPSAISVNLRSFRSNWLLFLVNLPWKQWHFWLGFPFKPFSIRKTTISTLDPLNSHLDTSASQRQRKRTILPATIGTSTKKNLNQKRPKKACVCFFKKISSFTHFYLLWPSTFLPTNLPLLRPPFFCWSKYGKCWICRGLNWDH